MPQTILRGLVLEQLRLCQTCFGLLRSKLTTTHGTSALCGIRTLRGFLVQNLEPSCEWRSCTVALICNDDVSRGDVCFAIDPTIIASGIQAITGRKKSIANVNTWMRIQGSQGVRETE